MKITYHIRKNLKEARKKAGLTQKEVAECLEISERYYQHIEAGQRTGDFIIWDTLEDFFKIHQRVLRENSNNLPGKVIHQEKHSK